MNDIRFSYSRFLIIIYSTRYLPFMPTVYNKPWRSISKRLYARRQCGKTLYSFCVFYIYGRLHACTYMDHRETCSLQGSFKNTVADNDKRIIVLAEWVLYLDVLMYIPIVGFLPEINVFVFVFVYMANFDSATRVTRVQIEHPGSVAHATIDIVDID